MQFDARHAGMIDIGLRQFDPVGGQRRLLPGDIELGRAAQVLAEFVGHPFGHVRGRAGEVGDDMLDPGIGRLDQPDAEIHDLEPFHRGKRRREKRLVDGIDVEFAVVGQNGIAALEGRMLHPVATEGCCVRHHAAVRTLVRPQEQA